MLLLFMIFPVAIWILNWFSQSNSTNFSLVPQIKRTEYEYIPIRSIFGDILALIFDTSSGQMKQYIITHITQYYINKN